MKEKDHVYSRYGRITPPQRAQWVRLFQKSGLSQQEFVARHGMGLSTLGKWLQMDNAPVGQKASSPGWQEVVLPAIAPACGWAAEIAFKNGSVLRLSSATAIALLEPWLDARS